MFLDIMQLILVSSIKMTLVISFSLESLFLSDMLDGVPLLLLANKQDKDVRIIFWY